MCDLNCTNLIDLSLEDDIPCSNTQIKTENATQPSEATKEGPLFISPTWSKRDSLDNNPFDCVQKLASRLDDPFEVVEKEACLKAQKVLKQPGEVKLGNLLSLSNDNLLDEEQMPVTPPILVIEELGKFRAQELDLESPPVLLNEKLPPDSTSGPDTDSNANSSAETSTSAKLKKNLEYRKRLLKLSISNAAFSSPIALKQSLEFEDAFGTPVSSMLSRAAEFGEHLLAAESPLKLIEDEDMSQETLNSIDSDKNFEADLEMLKIPILNELPSPAVEEISIDSTPVTPDVVIKTASLENALPNLEAIKAKLKAKKEEIDNNHQQEISSLIHNLKSLISSGNLVDKSKKQEASGLLESLSSALKPAGAKDTHKDSNMLTVAAPLPIKRQGTFDIDLQDNQKEINIDYQPLVQEMPNCMISSSATYDGETADEKQDLNLPEIAPLSSQTSPLRDQHYQDDNCENNLQTDVNDIMKQLSKLLINNSADNPPNNHNPTFIVVLNTNQLNHSKIDNSHQNVVDANQKSAFVTSYLENSINDGSPDLTKVNPMARRRSQSLSIHDKVKIVQLPSTPRSIHKQQLKQMDELPTVTTTPPFADKETSEFKTPARKVRRNSYTSGTPYTTQVNLRRSSFGSDNKNPIHLRRTQTLDTHHEGKQQQQHAIVRPMSMPSNNLLTFRPDLKKKPKHNTESIIKSNGPLKATIPVKKVAPMLKTSPPTPDKSAKLSTLHNISLQSQSKISRVPTTPLPAKGTSYMGVGVGYPSACSTPAAFTSPLKRTTEGPINKPRYSYMSVTPNPKSSTKNSSVSAGLKRRTITEFKAKSPLKPRVSSVGLAAAAAASSTSSRVSAGNSRLSISAGARISKTPTKATTSTATVKPTSRLSTRISVGGSALSFRNKENKRP